MQTIRNTVRDMGAYNKHVETLNILDAPHKSVKQQYVRIRISFNVLRYLKDFILIRTQVKFIRWPLIVIVLWVYT